MNRTTLPALLVLALAGGCYDARGFDVDAGGTADAGPVDTGTPLPPPPPDELDLLFVIDPSGSLVEEVASLRAALPSLMSALGSHYSSIHAGVITSDMGAGGFAVPTCVPADFGDDGVLRTAGNTSFAGCMAAYPSFLAWREGDARTPAELAADLGCVASGLDGCGYEQPLEAMLKALTPASPTSWTAASFVPVGTPGAPDGLVVPFFRMTAPHGGAANEGFVREGSMLAIVVVSDEEDCSAMDPELFNPASATYGSSDLSLRCFAFPEALHPVSRYVSGLLQLRRHPSRLAYFVLAGVPVDLAPAPGEAVDWERLVSPDPAVRDDRMEERVDPTMPNRLIPSCNVPGRGISFAPVRLVRTARQLEQRGARAGVGSLCQESFGDAMASLVEVLTR